VRVHAWGIALGYKLRRALITLVAVALAWLVIQVALSFTWMLTRGGG